MTFLTSARRYDQSRHLPAPLELPAKDAGAYEVADLMPSAVERPRKRCRGRLLLTIHAAVLNDIEHQLTR